MVIMPEDTLNDQKGMERAFRGYFEDIKTECAGTLNTRLNAELYSCDHSKRIVIIRAEIGRWMANPGGQLHGGIIAAYMDMVMGLLCRYYSGGKMTPTVHMDMNFMRGMPAEGTVLVKAAVTKTGRSICFTEGCIWPENEPGRILASASGSYFVQQDAETD